MHSVRFRHRRLAVVTAAILTLGTFSPPTAAAATPLVPTGTVLRSAQLAVTVDPAFPRVLGYATPDGGQLGGSTGTTGILRLNGTDYHPTVTGSISGNTAHYQLVVTQPEVTIRAELGVSGQTLAFRITGIDDPGKVVETLDLPDLTLVSVRSDQPTATLASAGLSVDAAKTSDSFAVVSSLPVTTKPAGKSYAFLSTDKLAAGVETNTLTEPYRLAVSTTAEGDLKRTGIASQPWVYREHNTKKITELPWAKVAVTGDRNGDHVVDWQDGAIAFRSIMVNAPGSTDVKDRVVPYISYNFASLAGTPFLKALDEVKKVSLVTDGLGQNVLLKGYQSEGHDSAHPDYGDHFNDRAGGLADLKTLISQGKKYGATFGVHINRQEAYPEAKNFSWALANPGQQCWGWLDQSYCDNKHADETSGNLANRLAQLKKAIPDPNLSYLYVDVTPGSGWDAYDLAHTLWSDGWQAATEFPSDWERESIWSHWANDPTYGGDNNRGINSRIIRFLRNDQKDVWSPDPLMPNPQLADFTGWQGRVDFTQAEAKIFTDDLPAKWIQHFQVSKWTDDAIDFTGGVRITKAGAGRDIWSDGHLVSTGGAYLLPWPGADAKLYHWNPAGGTTTWTLPQSWQRLRTVSVSTLTQTGRQQTRQVPVRNGQISLAATAKTPYVITRGQSAPTAQPVDFGQGGPVADPGFDSGGFSSWHPTGARPSIVDDARGQTHLQMASGAGTVSQQLRGLRPGKQYSASVWVQVTGPKRKATLSVSDVRGGAASVWTDSSPQADTSGVDDKTGTNYQRMKVLFTPTSSTATLTLSALAGAATVEFDDVRVVADEGANLASGGHYYTEDFEHVDQGWGPFVYTVDGGSLRTHLSELHAGYTRDTISGKWSLKTWADGTGLVYRTLPQTLRFDPSHVYRVRFDYQSDTDNTYSVKVFDGGGQAVFNDTLAQTTDRPLDSPPPATDPKPAGWTDILPPQGSAPHQMYDQTFTTGGAGCGDYSLGIVHNHDDNAAMTMDDLVVDDLGPAPATSRCPSSPVASVKLSGFAPERGQPNTVTAAFQNSTTGPLSNVDVRMVAPAGWSATAQSPSHFATVAAGATVEVKYAVQTPATAPSGSYQLTATASYEVNGHQAGTGATTSAVLAYRSLAEAYDNVGITDESATTAGTFDGYGNSFSAQALTSAGAAPGSTVTVDNVKFGWPSAPAGQPDNVTAAGQTVAMSGSGGEIAFLGSEAGAVQPTVTIHYTDGSTSTGNLGFPNWCCADDNGYGAKIAVDTDHNNTPTGPGHFGTHYKIYYNTIPADPTKTIAAVTLPNAPALHVFAMALKPLAAAPPGADTYASDLAWAQMTNGWGPAERDHSLGEDSAGDGGPLKVAGVRFDKGLGTASPGSITYQLSGKCTRFTAQVGQDDEKGAPGSVQFSVVADGATIYTSPVKLPGIAATAVEVPLTGVQSVQLVTGDGGDGNGNDHADWGNALFHCG
ncbi:endo-alpha-N-acetylgalactosaminidase family protein [Fodinicola feengrottensis]